MRGGVKKNNKFTLYLGIYLTVPVMNSLLLKLKNKVNVRIHFIFYHDNKDKSIGQTVPLEFTKYQKYMQICLLNMDHQLVGGRYSVFQREDAT